MTYSKNYSNIRLILLVIIWFKKYTYNKEELYMDKRKYHRYIIYSR